MKKVFYSILGCAALLCGGTAVAALSGDDAAGSVIKRAAEDGDTPYAYGVTDLSVTYDAATDKVKISFTTPNAAYWMPSYDDIEDFEGCDNLILYRNEGEYFDSETSVKLHEFGKVGRLEEMTWEEDAPEHGKYYYYKIVSVLNGPDGTPYNGSNNGKSVKVGKTIDPATEYVLIPGAQGAKEVTIKFKAPTTTDGGTTTITDKITKIEITRQLRTDYWGDPDVIATFEDVEPGQEISYLDNDPVLEEGEIYTYKLVLYYDGGKVSSYMNNEDALVGADQPMNVESVTAETQEDGITVNVTWPPFSGTGVHNGWVNPETLRYNVYRTNVKTRQQVLIAEGLTDPGFTDTGITIEGVYNYLVYTCVLDKESRSYTSNDVVAGPPAKMPFVESWPDYSATYGTWESTSAWSNSSSFTVYLPDYTSVKFSSFDGDNGMMVCAPYSYDVTDVHTLTSGRISMVDAVNPILSFEYLDLDPAQFVTNAFRVLISRDGGEFEPIDAIDVNALPGTNEWVNFTVSLADYVDCEYIKVQFEVTKGDESGAHNAIDKVQVREIMPVDLVVNSVKSSKKFYPNSSFDVKVSVSNTGDYFSEPFSLELTLGELQLAYLEHEGLEGFSSQTFTIPVTLPEDVEGGVQNIVATVTGSDLNQENNTGASEIEIFLFPGVDELTLTDNVLSWDAVGELPYNDGIQDLVEDFSNYDNLATEGKDGWVFIDGDGSNTYQFNVNDPSKFPLDKQPIGGVVVDPVAITAKFVPAVGDNCFLFVSAMGDSDDWLISPELPVDETQIISFKYLTPAGDLEKFEVMYSTTDNEPSSFQPVDGFSISYENTSYQWVELSVPLPEGTKYFAIHYTANYCAGLAIDDIHYRAAPANGGEPTTLLGYNVYCDGEKVNSEVLTETSFTVAADAPRGTYTVKAVYNNGEAHASNGILISDPSGIQGTMAAESGVKVVGNTVVITGEGDYMVADMAGRIVAKGTGSAEVALAAGTYVVTTSATTAKVQVK